MLFLTLATLALAGQPATVDLEDVGRYEDAVDQLLIGPPGCWELVGRASWSWDLGRFGSNRGDAVFAGRLDDGDWGAIHLKPLGELAREGKGEEFRVYAREARFAPLVGRIEGSRITVDSMGSHVDQDSSLEQNAESSNVLRRVLDRIGGSSESSWATWDNDRQGVVLHRAVPIGNARGAPEAELLAFFPGGEGPPVQVDVNFPESFHQGTVPRWRIENAVVHVRGQVLGDHVFPTAESFSFDFGLLGFQFSGAQTITYSSAVRCASDLPSTSPPTASPTSPTAPSGPAPAAPATPSPAPPAPAAGTPPITILPVP